MLEVGEAVRVEQVLRSVGAPGAGDDEQQLAALAEPESAFEADDERRHEDDGGDGEGRPVLFDPGRHGSLSR